jgi:hypothetical protein
VVFKLYGDEPLEEHFKRADRFHRKITSPQVREVLASRRWGLIGVLERNTFFLIFFLLVFCYIPSRRNPHPLPSTQNRDDQQREKPHDACKRPKRNHKPLPFYPLGNEKRPRKRNCATENADHYEAVARELVVGVDELERNKLATALHSQLQHKPRNQRKELT